MFPDDEVIGGKGLSHVRPFAFKCQKLLEEPISCSLVLSSNEFVIASLTSNRKARLSRWSLLENEAELKEEESWTSGIEDTVLELKLSPSRRHILAFFRYGFMLLFDRASSNSFFSIGPSETISAPEGGKFSHYVDYLLDDHTVILVNRIPDSSFTIFDLRRSRILATCHNILTLMDCKSSELPVSAPIVLTQVWDITAFASTRTQLPLTDNWPSRGVWLAFGDSHGHVVVFFVEIEQLSRWSKPPAVTLEHLAEYWWCYRINPEVNVAITSLAWRVPQKGYKILTLLVGSSDGKVRSLKLYAASSPADIESFQVRKGTISRIYGKELSHNVVMSVAGRAKRFPAPPTHIACAFVTPKMQPLAVAATASPPLDLLGSDFPLAGNELGCMALPINKDTVKKVQGCEDFILSPYGEASRLACLYPQLRNRYTLRCSLDLSRQNESTQLIMAHFGLITSLKTSSNGKYLLSTTNQGCILILEQIEWTDETVENFLRNTLEFIR